MASLLEEFEIHNISKPLFSIGGHPVAFTNSALFMVLAIVTSSLFMLFAMRRQAVIPGRLQMLAEKFYETSFEIVTGNAGENAKAFTPLIFTIFTFILFCNLFGMIPNSLAVTSHIIVNLAIALFLFLIIIVTGFVKHGAHFIMLFVPKGVPIVMVPPMIVIEFLSFAVRPFSLSIRLFANMLAGHILLAVFAGMTISLLTAGWLAGISVLPLIANIAITGFEFFVAFLQAYIYATLSAVYLRDAIEMH